MKKLLLSLAVFAISSVAFANTEIALNFFGSLPNTAAITDKDDSSLKIDLQQGKALGFVQDFNFYYGNRASNFDMGLGLFTAFNTFSSLEVENTFNSTGYGLNFNLGLGPVFRYTFNDLLSLYARPGVGLNLQIFAGTNNDEAALISFGSIIDLNIGGRFWFLNATGFHMGLDFGLDMNFISGYGEFAIIDASCSGNITKRIDTNLFLGLVFNFGDRGIDR